MIEMKYINSLTSYMRSKGLNHSHASYREMQEKMMSWYIGDVDKFHTYRETILGETLKFTRLSLGLVKASCEFLSKVVLNEKVVKGFEDNNHNTIYQNVIEENNLDLMMRRGLELACVEGDHWMITRKLANSITIDFIRGYNTEVIYEFNGQPVGILVHKLISDYRGDRVREFVHIMEVVYDPINKLNTITHELKSLNDEGDIDSTSSEWDLVFGNNWGDNTNLKAKEFDDGTPDINTLVELYNVQYPIFQQIKTGAINNLIDVARGLPLNVNALDAAKASDRAFDELDNEIENGQSTIFIDPESTGSALVTGDSGDSKIVQTVDKTKRHFVMLKGMNNHGTKPIEMYNPTLRIDQLSLAQERHINTFGWLSGLGSNFFNVKDGNVYVNEKQVITSNSALYSTKHDTEKVIGESLKVQALVILALNGITVPSEYGVKFHDGILQDDEYKYNKDLERVHSQLLSKRTFIQRHFPDEDVEYELEQIRLEQQADFDNVFDIEDTEKVEDNTETNNITQSDDVRV